MADEPVTTSLCYDAFSPYIAPAGRLPVLGKVRAQIDQLRAAVVNEALRTINDTNRTQNEINKVVAEIQMGADKTLAEVNLLKQKTQTELAQVADTLSTGTVLGVIGKQKGLFQKQTDGFDRDAEQKLAKIMVDSWSVRATVDGSALTAESYLSDPNIAAVIKKAQGGINVTPVDPVA